MSSRDEAFRQTALETAVATRPAEFRECGGDAWPPVNSVAKAVAAD